MKKLSLIAGLACLATVGGVFGAWVFGTGNPTDSDTTNIQIQSTEVVTNSDLAIHVTNTINLSVDQDTSVEGKAAGKGTITGSGSIVIEVTNPGAVGSGADYTISCTAAWNNALEGNDYVTVTNLGAVTDLTEESNPKTFTYSADAIISKISIANVMDAEDHAAMLLELNELSLTFTVTRTDV